MRDSRKACGGVLVLGDDDRTVLPIARSLGRRGIDVHLAWYPPDGAAAGSRYVKRLHEIRWYNRWDSAWKEQLRSLLDERRFELVLPATEHTVYALQMHRKCFEQEHRVYLLEDDVFATVIDKLKTYELAGRLGIHCPRSYLCDGIVSPSVMRSTGLPVIVKPITSIRDSTSLTKVFVRKATSWDDAQAYLSFLKERGCSAVLQPYVEGEGVGVSLLADRGRILTAVQHVRLHETSGYGSTYRETVPLDHELLGACSDFVGALRYSGVAMFEFRLNPAEGTWVLLEINGRFWGSLPLAVAAGIDFPFYLYQMLTGQQPQPVQDYRTGVRSRSLSGDLRWYWRSLRGRGDSHTGEKDGSLGWFVNRVSATEMLTSLVRGSLLIDRVDSLAWDDPWPTFREIAANLRRASRLR